MSTVSEMFVWASVGDSSAPPERIKAEVCTSCAALIPVATMDTHGLWHRDLERQGLAGGER